jgi:hypothetical protein
MSRERVSSRVGRTRDRDHSIQSFSESFCGT